MNKIFTILLITSLFLSSCSVDWNDEKDKRISELEKQVNEDIFKKKQECAKYKNEMESSMYKYIKKDSVGQDILSDIKDQKIRLYFLDSLYSNKEESCIFGFNEAEDKITVNGESYIETNYFIVDFFSNKLIYETNNLCNIDENCKNEYDKKIKELKGE